MAESDRDAAADEFLSSLLTGLPDHLRDLLQGERDEFRVFFRALSFKRYLDFRVSPGMFRDFLLLSDDFVGGRVVSKPDVFRKLKEFVDARDEEEALRFRRWTDAMAAAIAEVIAGLSDPIGDNGSFGHRNSIYESPSSLHRGSTSGTRSHFQGSDASHDGYSSGTPSHVSRFSRSMFQPQPHYYDYDYDHDPSIMNMGAREWISNETSMTAYTSTGRRSPNMFSDMHISNHIFEVGTQHHSQRTLPDQHNIHLDGANTLYDGFMSVPTYALPDHDIMYINTNGTHLNYSTSTRSHSQRLAASSHGSSPRPYNDSVFINMSNFGADAESYPRRSSASDQNPAGRVRAFPAMDLNYSTGPLSQSDISMASHGNSPDSRREFTDMSNNLPNYAAPIQSHSQRPLVSLNNPLGLGGANTIPAHGEFTNVPQTILAAEARATDETAGHSELFKTLVPVNCTNAYKAAKILMSTNPSALPFFIKIFGFLTVGSAAGAVFSSLAGLSLSTFRPNTLPFDLNTQDMIRTMHNVVVHTTAYAFIGTMSHEFLQDEPSLMWIVAGLTSLLFMTLMTFIGWRR